MTAATALPLMLRTGGSLIVEVTDGTAELTAAYREGVGFFYDLVNAAVGRIVIGLTAELSDHPVTALAITPGWLRSGNMLANFGVTESTWRDAVGRVPGSPSPSRRLMSPAAWRRWWPTPCATASPDRR